MSKIVEGIKKVHKNFRIFEIVLAWTVKSQSALRSLNIIITKTCIIKYQSEVVVL